MLVQDFLIFPKTAIHIVHDLQWYHPKVVVAGSGHVIDYLADSPLLFFFSFFDIFFHRFLLFRHRRREASLSATQLASRSVAIATAGYQLAFWLAEATVAHPTESSEECGELQAEILTRSGSTGRKRERATVRERSQSKEEGIGRADEGQGGRTIERYSVVKSEEEVQRRIQHASPFNMADDSYSRLVPSSTLITTLSFPHYTTIPPLHHIISLLYV